jgi:glutaredoxin
MMSKVPEVKLYGAARCHKTNYYKELLEEIKQPYQFLDVEENEVFAEELRGLYVNRKLNFPTITIGAKKLRNPYKEELLNWLSTIEK